MADEIPTKKRRPPTPKQKLYAARMLEPGKTNTQAFIETYQPKTLTNAKVMAYNYAKKQGVQESINEIIERLCPHIGDTAVTYLHELLSDPDKPDATKLKALDMLTRWKGWQSSHVTKDVRSLNVSVTEALALPGESKSEPVKEDAERAASLPIEDNKGEP